MTASTCPTSGKVRHANPQAAHRTLSHVGRRPGKERRNTTESVYRCDACHGWHVRSRGLRKGTSR